MDNEAYRKARGTDRPCQGEILPTPPYNRLDFVWETGYDDVDAKISGGTVRTRQVSSERQYNGS